jgi:hypothetical protein
MDAERKAGKLAKGGGDKRSKHRVLRNPVIRNRSPTGASTKTLPTVPAKSLSRLRFLI